MIAVKKPKKGEKVKKNDDAAYYDDEVPRVLDLRQRGVGPGRMEQQSQRINEMSNFQQDRLLDSMEPRRKTLDRGVMTSRRSPLHPDSSLPPGMSRQEYKEYQKRLEDMMPKEPAPGKDFMSRLRSKIGNTGTVIETGEPMDLAWRLLKMDDLEEQYMLETLTDGGNYPEKGPHIPQFAFRNDVTNNQTAKTPPPLNFMKRPGVAKPTKEEILANQGFTPQAIAAQDARNQAAAARMRELHQPKGG